MDWSWLGNAFNIVFGAIIGIAGKFIYDRRFAKHPDLRYTFGAPAKFGTGERERVYQNLEVTNAGTETTTDVRINFSRPNFDLSEYQVSYDGPHNFEKTDEQVGMLIPSLPPGDSVTLSFVFSPSKSNTGKIQDLFLSAKSKECVAKPLERAKSTAGDWSLAVPLIAITIALLALVFTLDSFSNPIAALIQLREQIQLGEQMKVEKIQNEIARLTVQVSNPVAPGQEAAIECYIDNMANNPFAGFLRIYPPSWAEGPYSERINLGSKSRKLVGLKFNVPKNVYPGKYRFAIELSGDAFGQPVKVQTTEMVEVRP